MILRQMQHGGAPLSIDDPRLQAFAEIFLAINAQTNLSAARDVETLYARHIEDSLSLLEVPEIKKASSMMDLGSGGGLPGLILAIMRPDATVTCLDATKKKVRAIEEMALSLGLTNVIPLHARAEEAGRLPKLRQSFDVVVARAVAPLATLLEYSAPFTRIHGSMVFMKGPAVEDEVRDAEEARRRLRVSAPRIETYSIAERDFSRVIYPLKEYVPKGYPRRNGLPRSKPLGMGQESHTKVPANPWPQKPPSGKGR